MTSSDMVLRDPLPVLVKQVIKGDRLPEDLSETREVLRELARRKSGKLPPDILVEQVLRITEGTDWPSRRAALEALLRRVGFCARDQLKIASRPADGRVLGAYVLSGSKPLGDKGRQRRSQRPYRTELWGVDPPRGSCDCPDYLRGSLGWCKHLLVVVEEVVTSPRKVAAAAAEQRGTKAARPVLRWNPIRDWTGPGDRVRGLWLDPDPASGRAPRGKTPGNGLGSWLPEGRPDPEALTRLDRRASLLEALVDAAKRREITAESGALAVVHAELEQARNQLSARAQATQIQAHTKTLKRKLYPYQKDGVRRLLEQRHLLLADDMGLGKTTQAVAACHALYSAGAVRRGLVIAPAALRAQWAREWEATTSKAPIAVVDGRADERARQYRSTQRGFLVISYEQLLRDLENVHRFAPDIVVLDEAQRIKNWATKSSAYVMTLRPAWRLVLTGTPMENRLEELATLLDWVDDVALSPKWRLVPWHTTWASAGARGRAGARHLDTLRDRLAPCVLRRVRREVLSQLPPRTDVRVPVEMTDQQREEHDSLSVPIAQLLQTGHRRPLTQPEFLKLMQLLAQQRILCNGMAQFAFDEVWPMCSRSRADDVLLRSLGSPKLPEFRRLIDELVLDQERKVVVFSQWRRMLRLSEWAVRDLLDDYGLRSVFFTGAETQRLRTQNIVDFHDDPAVRVMFLSDAGGVGLNLQRAANACVNLELPWNPAVLEQRIGRIYRLGQEQPIDVVNLVTEYGIEARIAGLVSNKKALFSGLFDGTTDEIRFETPAGFLADVERLVEPVAVPDLPVAGDSEPDELLLEAGDPSDGQPSVSEVPPDSEAPAPPDVSTPEPQTTEAHANAAHAGPSKVAPLFERVAVIRTPEGGLRLEAEPEAANELAQLLEGLAGLLRSSIVR